MAIQISADIGLFPEYHVNKARSTPVQANFIFYSRYY